MASPMARLPTKKAGGSHPQVKPDQPAFLRDGLPAYIAPLPGDRAFLPPSPA